MAGGKIAKAILLAMPEKGGGEGGGAAPDDESDDSEGGRGMGLTSAMSAFLKAQKAGDPKGMAKAFEDAHEICAGYESKDSGDTED